MTHAFREQETPNADPNLLQDNTHIGASNVSEALERFNARLPDKVRKNAVLAIEYLVTASPDDMKGKTRRQQDAYFEDALKWLRVRHGAENVIYAGIHRDETTPHMYAYVVPLDERGKLNCRAFLGGAKALTDMQTDFANRIGKLHGLERGIEGSKAKHTRIQDYYTRANAAFEPLPELPPRPTLREEPEKPGFFFPKDDKAAYERDHAAWLAEQETHRVKAKEYNTALQQRTAAAVGIARKHEARAKETDALRVQLAQQKATTGHYVQQAAKFEVQTRRLYEVAQLFTPEEVKAAQERKRQQDAEKARQAEIARQKAAEAAQRAEIEQERARRVTELPKLLQAAGGAAYTFAAKAASALKQAGNDPAKVDWRAVEATTAREAIGKNGQSAQSVVEALTRHSPGRADPQTHEEIKRAVERNAPALRAEYEQTQQQRPSRGPAPGR